MFNYSKVTLDCTEVLKNFQSFLEDRNIKSEQEISKKDINDYIMTRREQIKDINYTICAIVDYFIAVENGELAHEAGIHLDAIATFNNLSKLTKEELGDDVWQRVFGDVEMPKVGWTLDEITDFTRQMHEKMRIAVPRERIENMFQKYAHGYEQSFNDTLHEILVSKGVDGLINHLNSTLLKELEDCYEKGELWCGQPVDDSVIKYVRDNPMNCRNGDKIINKQIPNMLKAYLLATDEKMKRYSACHCAIKKQSILQDKGGLSHSLCNCSFGHSKKQFDFAFGKQVSGRVVKTVMDAGCLECIFEIDIPDGFIE